MDNSFVLQFIAGLMCIMVWIIENILVASHPCAVNYPGGETTIDCEKKLITPTLPTDLDIYAVALDISSNNLCRFSRQNFSKFKLLNSLVMTDLKCVPPGSKVTKGVKIELAVDSFHDLPLLETLDISHSPLHISEAAKFQWPKNLKLLRLNGIHNVSFDFSELRQLEILVAINCNKDLFPLFHPKAPLTFVDLRENKISNIVVEDVAKYCLLGNLMINMLLYDFTKPNQVVQKPPYDDFHCMCLRLKAWAQMKDIYGLDYLECFIKSTGNITKASTLQKKCNGSFEEAEEIYETCWSGNVQVFYLHLGITLIVAVLLVGGLVFFLRKTFGIYQGSRNEIIEDPNARDISSSYYESDSEVEKTSNDSPSTTPIHKISSESSTKPSSEPPIKPSTQPTIAPSAEPPTKPSTAPSTESPTKPSAAPSTKSPTKPSTEPPTKPSTKLPTKPSINTSTSTEPHMKPG